MGSGAFLVECCRQLADEVVAAWGRAHEIFWFFRNFAIDCLKATLHVFPVGFYLILLAFG